MSQIVKINDQSFVVGLEWRVADSEKEAVKAAKTEARSLQAVGSDDERNADRRSLAVWSVFSSNQSDSLHAYGFGRIEDASFKPKGKIHSLAAWIAKQHEDGLYVLRLPDDVGFLLVGVSSGVVVPRTDLILKHVDELAQEVALMVGMTNLPLYVEEGIDIVFGTNQSGLKIDPSARPGGLRPVGVVGASGRSQVQSAVVGIVLLAILSGAAWAGWQYYQKSRPKAPSAEQLEAQRRQQYDNEARDIQAKYGRSSLEVGASKVTRAFELASVPSSGYMAREMTCDAVERVCRVSYRKEDHFLSSTERLLEKWRSAFPSASVAPDSSGQNGVVIEARWDVDVGNTTGDRDTTIAPLGRVAQIFSVLSSSPTKDFLVAFEVVNNAHRAAAETTNPPNGEKKIVAASWDIRGAWSASSFARFYRDMQSGLGVSPSKLSVSFDEGGMAASVLVTLTGVFYGD